MFILQDKPIELNQTQITHDIPTCGALTSFEGMVRLGPQQGKKVSSLLYIADEPVCIEEGNKIVEEACLLFHLSHARCIQRFGSVKTGERAIWIGAWSTHRDESFKGCRYIIEEIKIRLRIWKKEFYTDGTSKWIYGSQESLCL